MAVAFHWTMESASAELTTLIDQIDDLSKLRRRSAEHVEWAVKTTKFLGEVFGEDSSYFSAFVALPWEYRGTMLVHLIGYDQAVEAKHQHAYVEQLEAAKGLLKAAASDLKLRGIEGVYEGKSTAPESSAIIKLLSLTEHKLRRTIRNEPTIEREVQDAVENLFIASDLDYAREVDRIEYSSKSYVPDFTLRRLDLAVEIKLCNTGKREKEIIAEINDDILAYKQQFGNLLFVVYDIGQIRDVERFRKHFEQQEQVVVQVVKH